MTRLYHVAAYFKDGAQATRERLSVQWNEHLRQNHPRLKLAGMLLGADGCAVGVMTLVDAQDLQQAQSYLADSPYQEAGLYEAVQVCEVVVEVGSLDRS